MFSEVPWTFRTWLANFEGVDLPIGDLARDVRDSGDMPDTEDYDRLKDYFSGKGLHVIDTFKPVWKFYQATR